MDFSFSDSSQERVPCKELNDSVQTRDGLKCSLSDPRLVAVLQLPGA